MRYSRIDDQVLPLVISRDKTADHSSIDGSYCASLGTLALLSPAVAPMYRAQTFGLTDDGISSQVHTNTRQSPQRPEDRTAYPSAEV